MAINLATLLGLQAAAPEAVTPEDVITATAPRPQERALPQRAFDLPDRPEVEGQYVLNDNRIPPNEQDLKEIIPRSGMFGIRGTLRDVLGAVGDAFLVNAGRDRVYAPARQQEREGDALFGFSQNPLQAIERLAAVNPEAARAVHEDYQNQQLRSAQMESLAASRDSMNATRDQTRRDAGMSRLIQWVGSGLSYPLLANAMADYGYTEEDLASLGVRPDMTDEERRAFAGGGMTTYQQARLPQYDEGLDISRDRAESARISATRPRSQAQPRSQSAIEYRRELEDRQRAGDTLSESELNYLNPSRASSNERQRPAAPPSSPTTGNASRFRRVN